MDALNVPLVDVDAYGNFLPGAEWLRPARARWAPDGICPARRTTCCCQATRRRRMVDLGGSGHRRRRVRTGHMFLADIAHSANPFSATTGLPLTRGC